MIGRLKKVLSWLWQLSKGYRLIWCVLLVLDILLPFLEVGTAFLSKDMVDQAVAGQTDAVIRTIVLFGLLLLVIQILHLAENILSGRQAIRSAHSVRSRLLERLDRTEWRHLQTYHSGDLMTRLSGDVQVVSDNLIQGVPKVVSTLVKVGASFGALLWFDPTLAWIALAVGPLLALMVRFGTSKLTDLSERMLSSQSRYMAHLQEWLQHLALVKVFGSRKAFQNRLDARQAEYLGLANKQMLVSSGMHSFFAVGFSAGYLLAFLWGVFRLAKGTISFGTMTAFVQLVVQLQEPFAEAGDMFANLLGTVVCSERLMALEQGDSEDEGANVAADVGADVAAGVGADVAAVLALPKGPVSIRLEQVRFSYGEPGLVYETADLFIPAGSVTAVMGPSGEGKSTLGRLLLALVHPDAGHVWFQDESVDSPTQASVATRRWVAYVPQESSLFSGTILQNVRMGNPGATEAEVVTALKQACAWEFLETDEAGIQKHLGEDGSGLSVGQLQRIAIARALVRKAPVLLLDEATSALDAEVEARIMRNLSTLPQRPTVLLITHREAAAAACDMVYHLSSGFFRKIGTP